MLIGLTPHSFYSQTFFRPKLTYLLPENAPAASIT